AYLENLMKIREQIRLRPEDYAGDFKKEAEPIIEHVKNAYSEIYLIEHMENKALNNVNKNINRRIKEFYPYLLEILKNKENKIKELSEIVSGLIEDTGPKRDSTFLLLNVKRKGANFIMRHSINVCLIAIATAMELTKIMTSKLNEESVRGDFKKLTICNRKIFNKEELVKLGVSALIHDIGLLEGFPDLKEDTKFGIKDKSKIEMHPNNAYHLLSQLKIDYDIRQAVLQHHEKIDGSGYPDGVKGRMFSKYSLVLSFADQIELYMNKNPFYKKMHPHRAIMHILTKERFKFDNDVLLAYCRAASVYPIGSWVLLSNNKIGLVFRTNKESVKNPIVKLVYTAEMKELLKKEFVDLSRSDLKITELIDIEALEMLDENLDRFIFDEREFVRVPVNIEAKYHLVNAGFFYDSRLKNISAGGTKMETDGKLRLGDEILLNFKIEDKPFKNIKGIVVWANGKNAPSNHYGIRFLQMDNFSKDYLLNLAYNKL
ncbi:MAG: HD domain-containing phosphohydrolase, partial [Promethearchaeota archaeon]